jgi:hypothetical protein
VIEAEAQARISAGEGGTDFLFDGLNPCIQGQVRILRAVLRTLASAGP